MASPGDKADHTFHNIRLRGRTLVDRVRLFLSNGIWKARNDRWSRRREGEGTPPRRSEDRA